MLKKKSNLSVPPGQSGLPFIGETIAFLTETDFVKKRQAKYGSVFRTQLFGRPTIIITGAEANHFLLTNENKYFVATWPKSTKNLLGAASLAVKQGEFHTSRRKLLYQAFQPRALTNYIPTMEVITKQYLERWKNLRNIDRKSTRLNSSH